MNEIFCSFRHPDLPGTKQWRCRPLFKEYSAITITSPATGSVTGIVLLLSDTDFHFKASLTEIFQNFIGRDATPSAILYTNAKPLTNVILCVPLSSVTP